MKQAVYKAIARVAMNMTMEDTAIEDTTMGAGDIRPLRPADHTHLRLPSLADEGYSLSLSGGLP